MQHKILIEITLEYRFGCMTLGWRNLQKHTVTQVVTQVHFIMSEQSGVPVWDTLLYPRLHTRWQKRATMNTGMSGK